MFFKKKPEPVDTLAGLVKCETCKHLVSKWDAQTVVVTVAHSSYTYERSYCPEHKVIDARIEIEAGVERYYKEFQVSKDGTPIGYVKEEKKQTITSWAEIDMRPGQIVALDSTKDLYIGTVQKKRKYTKTAKRKKARGKK